MQLYCARYGSIQISSETSNRLGQIIMQLIIVLDINTSFSPNTDYERNNTVKEIISLHSFECYSSIVTIWCSTYWNKMSTRCFSGPYLAQIVQLSLLHAKTETRSVSGIALDSLYCVLFLTSLSSITSIDIEAEQKFDSDGSATVKVTRPATGTDAEAAAYVRARESKLHLSYIEWRTYFPGIFSSLFLICSGKNDRYEHIYIDMYNLISTFLYCY
jgi:hypothetical protein